MQTFKITKSQLGQMMRDFNLQRKQSLKTIKSFYAEIQTKQHKIFDTAVQRLTQNLSNFKETKYKKMHLQIDHNQITEKYEKKLNKIAHEINKLDVIIKNGAGKIVQKPFTSRVSMSSMGSESRRTVGGETLRTENNEIYLERGENRKTSLQDNEEKLRTDRVQN